MTVNSSPTITIEDVGQSGCLGLLRQHLEAGYSDLEALFKEAMAAANAEGRVGPARALHLLAGVCSLRLVPADRTSIYRRSVDLPDDSKSMQLNHLGADEVAILAQLAAHIPHPALRARLADLVWIREPRRGAGFARIAAETYSNLAIARVTWKGERQACWHRALQLALQVRWVERTEAIEQALLSAFFGAREAMDREPLGYLKPLTAERRNGGQSGPVAEALAEHGRRRLETGRAFDAEAFFTAAAYWFGWAREWESKARMQALAAAAMATHGDARDGAIARHLWYIKAIAANRMVEGRYRGQLGIEEAIGQLRLKLDMAGHQALGQVASIPLPRINVADRVQAAVDHVKDRPPFDALLAFCGLDSPFDKAGMEAAAERNLSQRETRDIINVGVLASTGRQVNRRDISATRAKRIAAEARSIFRLYAGTAALFEILPALGQLRAEHAYGLDDFIALAQRSPVVPADRAMVVGQGLYAGYCGDMVQAMYILMPQFEHLVHHVLNGADAFATEHDLGTLDPDVGLSGLVERPEMEREFGYGLTLAIHALMCEKAGPNLRAEVARGRATQGVCESAHARYTWWLVLQLVVETFARSISGGAGHAPTGDQDDHKRRSWRRNWSGTSRPRSQPG